MPDVDKLVSKLGKLDDEELAEVISRAVEPRDKKRKGQAGKAEAKRRFAGKSGAEIDRRLADGLGADQRARQGRA